MSSKSTVNTSLSPARMRFVAAGTAALNLIMVGNAHAHIGVGPTAGFAAGFIHPLGGLDHVLAMVTVGLWAAQQQGRALWAIPLAFVGAMAAGGVLGMMGVGVPFAEQGILLSVMALGLVVALALRPPLALAMTIVGAFAVLHGHAHGNEMPISALGWWYGAGFLLATAVLHAVGIAGAVALRRLMPARSPAVLRYAGAAVALAGACFWLT